MRIPVVLLKFAAKAALNAASAGIAGDFVVDVLPEVAQDIWNWWSASRTPAERQQEVEALAQAPPRAVHQAVAAVVDQVAADAAPAVREALEAYLDRLPENIREALARPDDPTGTTVPPDHPLQNANDLLALLTAGKPRTANQTAAADGDAAHGDAALGRIRLNITAGPHKGQQFAFVGHDTFLVGRSPQAHFRLSSEDKYFSRVHFMVEVNPPHCRLLDMGSRNGTYVNGVKADGAVDLHDGDCIKAGHTLLRVAIEAGTPTARTTAAAAVSQPPARGAGAAESGRKPPTMATPPVTVTLPPVTAGGTCPGCGGPLQARAAVCPVCLKQSHTLAQPIDGYQIIRELGRGSMGVVHLAVRAADESVVALKTITPAMAGSESQVARFLREARILEQLDHPHIVAFREMGESNGQFFFAMDFVRGTDAARLLKAVGRLQVSRAVRLVCQMLGALAYAHEQRFVHRDIKPANLLVSEEAAGETARLGDFGLARVYQASQLSGLSMTGDIGGTVAFMAPEQITSYRQSRPPVDQYAAAAALYNLLTGKLVFDLPGNRQQRLLMILQEEPVPIRKRRADLPKELAEVIHRALAKQPADRFGSVKEFRKQLLPFRKT
jgi:serine/threonine-protein kinase